MNTKSCLTALALALASSMGWAQYDSDPTIATEVGSGLTGLGSAAEGIGTYNYYTAGAVRELQEARALAIDNHRQRVQNWYALKSLNRQARGAKLDPLTPDQLSAVIEWQRPDRLPISQFNATTGELHWPVALHGNSFESERESLNYAFQTRTSRDRGADSAFYSQVRRTTEGMLAKLRDRIDLFSPNEFIAAKKFLVGLRYEAMAPADMTGLAMR
jgi:hypothetical protein